MSSGRLHRMGSANDVSLVNASGALLPYPGVRVSSEGADTRATLLNQIKDETYEATLLERTLTGIRQFSLIQCTYHTSAVLVQ